MAKFIFKMESILSVKEKLEEQAKAEYSIEIIKLGDRKKKSWKNWKTEKMHIKQDYMKLLWIL